MIELKLLLECKDANIIMRSLNVDNVNFPEGMTIESNVKNNLLEITIRMQLKNANDILTVRNTADEILTHIKALRASLDSLS
ncbi:KEOPS complex subunit Pcc1 [Sulfolobus tengchongensis]|uniref:KEOPS complex subunit Pcc1 n=1 Tax=Sulfolobus tengchongensis TaxID=207809 RepID=A0AAX4L0S3_9CREN